jgi:NAD+ synthase (glutamine-hydrolysing)
VSDILKVALAQIDLLVGDVQGNTARVVSTARRAHEELAADLVVFPELALSGYPPEDLLFHRGFRRQIEAGLERVRNEIGTASVVVGYPEYSGRDIYNAAALISGGMLAANHRKSARARSRRWSTVRGFVSAS